MKRIPSRSSAAFLLLTLAACNAPDTTLRGSEPLELAEAWRGAATPAGQVGGEAWWLDFPDPELDALVREALARSRDLARLAASVRAAREGARIARAAGLPSLDATLGASRRRQNFIGLPIPGSEEEVLSTTFTNWDLGLEARWELDLWDRLGSAERAAGLDAAAAEADLRAARHALAAAVARSWFLLVEARLQQELALRTVESFAENERVVRDRYESGLVSALDLRSASASTRSARALLTERERALSAARRSLEVLLGRYPEGELAAAPDLAPLPPAVPAGLPAELLGRRPDLVAAEVRVRAAEERIGEARADLYPSLVLTGQVGTVSQEARDLLDGDFGVWSLAGRLLEPIYDGGRRKARLRAAAAERDALAAAFVQAFLVACAEVEDALANEGHLAERVEHLALALEDARVAEELSRDQYREGLVALVTVLDAQRRALDAESAWLAARRTLLENRVALHAALGGGFEALAEEPQEDGAKAERVAAAPSVEER